MRIAYFSNFSPKKLGTGEGRLVAFANSAKERGHSFTVFGGTPVHPEVSTALAATGAAWQPLDSLKNRPLRSAMALARDFDVLQLNMIPPRSRLAFSAYAAWPAKVLFVDRVSGPLCGTSEFRPSWRRQLDRVTMSRVHQFVGITEYVRVRGKKRFGLPEKRTCTIYNGVDTQRFAPRPGRKREDGPLKILAVASLIPEKGIETLIKAVADLEGIPWLLTVVGEGHAANQLKKLAEDLGVGPSIRFLGLRDDVPELLSESHVFVHPAVWEEALGNTVLEGMASGCPVIASRVGGIPELARDGEEALFMEPGNWRELSQFLVTLAKNSDQRDRLGRAARARVLRDFSLEASIARHLDCCEAAARGDLLR